MTPSLSTFNLLAGLTELREIHTFTGLFKDTINEMGEQPDEEIPRVRSGRFCPRGVGVHHPLGVDVYIHLEAP